MIDIDQYEGCLADMKHYDLWVLAEEMFAEVKQLRKVLKDIHYDLTFKGTPEEMNSKALSTLSEVMYVD